MKSQTFIKKLWNNLLRGRYTKNEKLQGFLEFDKVILNMKTKELFIQIDDNNFFLSMADHPLENISLGYQYFKIIIQVLIYQIINFISNIMSQVR